MEYFVAIASVVTSLSSAVLAWLSVWLTAKENNKHQEKMKRIEFYETHRAEVIERFLQRVGGVLYYGQTKDNFTNLGQSVGEIYLYTPPELWDTIDQLIEMLPPSGDAQQRPTAKNLYKTLCKELNKYAPRSEGDTPKKKNRKTV